MEYFEDLNVGETTACGTVTAEREEMVAFAERYDPQPFHVDPAAAVASPFEGLVASGWYTASVAMRRLVETVLSDLATSGARGVDQLRWPAPVRPGDRLTVESTVRDKSPESTNHGLVKLGVTAERIADDDTTLVLSMVGLPLVERR